MSLEKGCYNSKYMPNWMTCPTVIITRATTFREPCCRIFVNQKFSHQIFSIPNFQVTENLTKLSVALSNQDVFSIIRDLTTIEQLSLTIEFTTELEIREGSIPNSVVDFSLLIDRNVKNFNFKSTLQPGSIPVSVKKLTINHHFFKHDPTLIPSSVTSLSMNNWSYYKGETDLIPPSIVHLRIGMNDTQQSLAPGCFPDGIETLDFGYYFSKSADLVPGVIPYSVKNLKILNYDSALKKGVIPPSVEILELGSQLRLPIGRGVIPNGVKVLTFGTYFNQPILKDSIPDSITQLNIATKNIPPILSPEILPPNISIKHIFTLEPLTPNTFLPPTIEFLDCQFCRIYKGLLPHGLKTLILRADIVSIEINSIPNTVTSITFEKMVEIPIIIGILPPSLKYLKFNRGYNAKSPVFPLIPHSVETLFFGGFSNNIIPAGSLPESMLYLNLGINFSQSLGNGVLPSKLKNLEIGSQVPMNLIELPESIETLTIHDSRSKKY
eukprot:gene5098-6345_t